LRLALAKARANNVPKDVITRAIKKGTGGLEGASYVEKTYEGYGAGGVALIVECLTDNINRTVGEVRYAFSRNGGNLGTDGSVSWMFKRKGVIVYPSSAISDYEAMLETAIESGAQDVRESDGQYELVSEPEDFDALRKALEKFGAEPEFCEITMIPENFTKVDPDKVPSLEKLINALEDNDDVQNVYHNGDWEE
jgi:YebC/PmpR family DNA-binding regulatory protein